MGNVMTFNEVLESADKLSLDEQETLTEVLHRRIIEYRRAELAREIQNAQQEFKEDKCKPATPSELMKEILSKGSEVILLETIGTHDEVY